jgi:hypothetical protein
VCSSTSVILTITSHKGLLMAGPDSGHLIILDKLKYIQVILRRTT